MHLANQDLDRLQARATARLANKEKDFKSTIVVSENDVFVLPNTRLSRKRSTKKPQRYNESLNAEEIDEFSCEKEYVPTKAKRLRSEVPPIPVPNYTYDRRVTDKMRHVTVDIPKLIDLGVEPWCMVHCLYKCYCKGAATTGKPFTFEKIKGSNQASLHWEVAPARRAHYTFDRETNEQIKPKKPKVDISPVNVGAARTREIRKDDYTHRSLSEVRTLRGKCEEIENAKAAFLQKRIKECYGKFRQGLAKRKEINYTINNEMQVALGDHSVRSKNTSSAKSACAAETTVDKLNRLITETMRNICNLQRNHVLELNTQIYQLSYISWRRMIDSYNKNELFIWHTKLSDHSVALFVTTTNERPRFNNVVETKKISEVHNQELPIVAKLIIQNIESPETVQLGKVLTLCFSYLVDSKKKKFVLLAAVALFRLSKFWRLIGVIHSKERYVKNGMSVNPHPNDNPTLTRKIETLHQHLTQERKKMLAAQIAGAQPQPVKQVNKPLSVLKSIVPGTSKQKPQTQPIKKPALQPAPPQTVPPSTTLVPTTISKLDETQLQMLLPIPLIPNKRWLMMDIGDDFTHIWLSQWQKFLSLNRIKDAVNRSRLTGKTISLAPPASQPEVYVTSVRPNTIFIGPYYNNEPQKLALFYETEDNKKILSENYAKLSTSKPFTKKSIGHWIHTKKACPLSKQQTITKNSNAQQIKTSNVTSTQTSQSLTNEVPAVSINNDIGLKIKNVFSVNEQSPAHVPLLVPIKMPEKKVADATTYKNSVVKVFDLSKVRIVPPKTIKSGTDAISKENPQSSLPSISAVNGKAAPKPSSSDTIEISDDDDEVDSSPTDINGPKVQTVALKRKRRGHVFSSCRDLGGIPVEIDSDSITLNFIELKKDVVLNYNLSDGRDGMTEVNNYLMR